MTKITKAKQLELNGRILTRKLPNNFIKKIVSDTSKKFTSLYNIITICKTHVGISEYAKNSL